MPASSGHPDPDRQRTLSATTEPTISQLTAFASLLERAGLLEIAMDEEGREGYRLTADGRCVNRMLAMVNGRDADEMLDALLVSGTPTLHSLA